jgi:hypothetical protein
MISLITHAGFSELADHRSFFWRTVLVARG